MSVTEATSPKSRRAINLAARIGLLLFSLTIAGVGSEVAIRFVASQPASWMDVFARRPGLPFFVLAPKLDETVSTGEARWRILTDARGRRIPATAGSKSDAKPATYVLGDSFAFGNGVDYAESFVGLSDAEDPGHRWINLAVPGLGPLHYRILLEEALDQDPAPQRLLVVTYLGNDFFDCVWNKDVPVRNGIPGDTGGLKSFLKRNSHFYRLCSNLWHAYGGRFADDMDSKDLYEAAAWEREPLGRAETIYRDEFAKISALCKSRGIDLFACVIPTRRSVAGFADGGSSPKEDDHLDLTLPSRKARAVLEELAIPFVDVSRELADLGAAKAYFAFDGHLTPAGNRIVARGVAKRWTSNSLEDPSKASPRDSSSE